MTSTHSKENQVNMLNFDYSSQDYEKILSKSEQEIKESSPNEYYSHEKTKMTDDKRISNFKSGLKDFVNKSINENGKSKDKIEISESNPFSYYADEYNFFNINQKPKAADLEIDVSNNKDNEINNNVTPKFLKNKIQYNNMLNPSKSNNYSINVKDKVNFLFKNEILMPKKGTPQNISKNNSGASVINQYFLIRKQKENDKLKQIKEEREYL